jgi:acyl carrier protein
MTSNPTTDDSLRLLVAQVMGVPPDKVTDDFGADTAPAWTSLKQLMLISQVESRFGVVFSNQEVGELTSYRRFAELLRNR